MKSNPVDLDIYHDPDLRLLVDHCVSVHGKLVISGDTCREHSLVLVVPRSDITDHVVKLYDLNHN